MDNDKDATPSSPSDEEQTAARTMPRSPYTPTSVGFSSHLGTKEPSLSPEPIVPSTKSTKSVKDMVSLFESTARKKSSESDVFVTPARKHTASTPGGSSARMMATNENVSPLHRRDLKRQDIVATVGATASLCGSPQQPATPSAVDTTVSSPAAFSSPYGFDVPTYSLTLRENQDRLRMPMRECLERYQKPAAREKDKSVEAMARGGRGRDSKRSDGCREDPQQQPDLVDHGGAFTACSAITPTGIAMSSDQVGASSVPSPSQTTTLQQLDEIMAELNTMTGTGTAFTSATATTAAVPETGLETGLEKTPDKEPGLATSPTSELEAEAAPTHCRTRSEAQRFWDNVRAYLYIPDEEIYGSVHREPGQDENNTENNSGSRPQWQQRASDMTGFSTSHRGAAHSSRNASIESWPVRVGPSRPKTPELAEAAWGGTLRGGCEVPSAEDSGPRILKRRTTIEEKMSQVDGFLESPGLGEEKEEGRLGMQEGGGDTGAGADETGERS